MYRIRWTVEQRDKFRARWVAFREGAGMTQVVMAGLMGISPREVSRIERGSYVPRGTTVVAFVKLEGRYREAAERERGLSWVPGGEEGI